MILYKTEMEKRKSENEKLSADLAESQKSVDRLNDQIANMTSTMAELKEVHTDRQTLRLRSCLLLLLLLCNMYFISLNLSVFRLSVCLFSLLYTHAHTQVAAEGLKMKSECETLRKEVKAAQAETARCSELYRQEAVLRKKLQNEFEEYKVCVPRHFLRVGSLMVIDFCLFCSSACLFVSNCSERRATFVSLCAVAR